MNIKVGSIMSILFVVMCVTGLSVAAPTTTGPFGTVDFFVMGNSSGNVYVFPSYGNGSFADKELVENIGSGCLGSAIADFDNDGDLDLTIQNVNGDSYLLINDGTIGFAQTKVAEGLSLSNYSAESTTADFNNDGYYDYVVPSSGAYIYLFTNNKNNTFSKSTISAEWLVTGNKPHLDFLAGVDTGDFNEDGNMDFIIAEYRGIAGGTDLVYSYIGNGDGTFTYKFVFDNTDYRGGDTLAVVASDFDNDGHCDAIVGQDDDVDPGQTWLYKGDGTGNFTYFGEAYDTNPSIESGGDCPGSGCADAYDFDGDGNPDVVASGSGEALFFKGNGNGTFQASIKVDEYMGRGISAPPIEVKPEISPIFTIADACASPNHTTTTQITISNMTNFGAATVTLSYDPSVVHITDVTSGDVGTPIVSSNNTAGTSTIVAYVSTIPGPDSPIVFANLEILAVGRCGEMSPLTLEITTLADANGTTVPATTENGVFTIAGLRGDADGDSVVNVVDAMFVAQYAVGNRDASTLNMANADANLDGGVDVVDAMFIAQYVVGARTW